MTLADQASRDAVANDLDVNMLVEAAAGTGKTTSLVTRIASLIRTGRCTPDSLAAITFTVKAAAHLRESTQEALEKALLVAEGVERERLARAIETLDRAFIGTTHAFCARLLRERPVEAGLDPEFEELDDVTAALRMHEFWSEWYESQPSRRPEELRTVLEAGVKANHLKTAFTRLVEYSDVEMVANPCARPELRPSVDRVLELVARVEPRLPDDSLREKQDPFEKMMRTLIRVRDSSNLDDPLKQLAFLEEGDHVTTKATKQNWADGEQAKSDYLEYQQLAAAHVRPIVRRWREYVHCIVVEFLRPAVAAYEEQRLRDGTLTFNDLLLRARDLLRDHPQVRRYFQKRFTHVLVDEFQDTDPIQAEVLFYLTGENVEERTWRALVPRPGSLFIVGDPKQSIYRFRRADITTYNAVRERIEQTNGVVVPLQTNFRSHQLICDFVNERFRVLFDRDDVEAKRQAAHVDLIAGTDERAPMQGVYVLETPDGNNGTVAEAEGACIAKWIRDAVDAGTHAYGDFLLVSDRKYRLPIYAQALEEQGIRYEITGGEAFAQSEDLRLVMPLLRAVADPDDAVALAAFLRGPLCGASDDALYRYVQAGGRWSVYRIPDDTPEEVRRGLELVKEGIDATRELPPAAAMARIFERAGIITTAASEQHGGTRAGNALLALAIARRDSASGLSFGDIVAELHELLETQAKIEELNVDPAAADVVRLMNLHQVKGLEARVVFLIDPVDEREHEPDLHVERESDASRGYVAIRESRGYSTRDIALPQEWDRFATIERDFRRAERKRLLYVAATRARSLLVAGVRLSKKGRVGIWSSLVQHVQNLLPPVSDLLRTPAARHGGISVEEAAREINARLDHAREASYSVLPITKIAHDNHVELLRAEEGLGKGTSWGRVLHRLFEALVRVDSLDVRAYAGNLLTDEERDPVEVDEVVRVVEAVQSSPLWSRIRNASERYVEVPFALMVRRHDVGLEGSGETLLHGVIDLVFREGDTWYVVDYKTDSTAGRLDSLVAYYRPQVEHYVRFWSQLTGGSSRGALFFVDGCEYVEV